MAGAKGQAQKKQKIGADGRQHSRTASSSGKRHRNDMQPHVKLIIEPPEKKTQPKGGSKPPAALGKPPLQPRPNAKAMPNAPERLLLNEVQTSQMRSWVLRLLQTASHHR